MTYDEILPLVRREKFVPLRVTLNDGRSYDLRRFGQFMLVRSGLTVQIPYDFPIKPIQYEHVRIQYSEIKEVIEVPGAETHPGLRSVHGPA